MGKESTGLVRQEVRAFVARGPLPHELDIPEQDLAERTELLSLIEPPLNQA